MNSPPLKTTSLKVEIKCKPTFSVSHTPVITENMSYTYTPNSYYGHHNDNDNIPITPITPIPPKKRNNNNYSDSLSSSSCYHHHSNSSQNSQNSQNQFPDTAKLNEIDEKKQSNSKNSKNSNSKIKINKLSLINVDTICDESEDDTLLKYGYTKYKHLCNTLQGNTFIAKSINNELQKKRGDLVIKITKKLLYNKGITITSEGKAYNIEEDILSEAKMMKVFMNNNPPLSLIKFYDFFQDKNNYYLVMEHGGTDFFDFIVKCHELINNGKLSLKEWRKQCKFIFAQMIEFIKWLHYKMNYCHLDISLENLLISNTAYFDSKTGKLNKCYIKFIDFGLAQQFDLNNNPLFLSKKYVGKTHYKSPKVYSKKNEFMANKADIWSLGICLFMMIIGAPPYNKPSIKDPGFRFIKNGKMTKLLYSWGRLKYVTPNLYDLIERMLCYDESKRITLNQIIQHRWLKIYFPNNNNNDIIKSKPKTPLSPSLCVVSRKDLKKNALNIMIPQQAVSISTNSPNNTSNNNIYTNIPTPILESQTSFASLQVDINDKHNDDHTHNHNDNEKKIIQGKKKKKGKFFKLSLSIFGSTKMK